MQSSLVALLHHALREITVSKGSGLEPFERLNMLFGLDLIIVKNYVLGKKMIKILTGPKCPPMSDHMRENAVE